MWLWLCPYFAQWRALTSDCLCHHHHCLRSLKVRNIHHRQSFHHTHCNWSRCSQARPPKALDPSCTTEHGWEWSIWLQGLGVAPSEAAGRWEGRWGEVDIPWGHFEQWKTRNYKEDRQIPLFLSPSDGSKVLQKCLEDSLMTKETAGILWSSSQFSNSPTPICFSCPPCLILSLAPLGWACTGTFPGSLSSLALSPALFSGKPRLGQRPCRWKVSTTKIREKRDLKCRQIFVFLMQKLKKWS